VIRVNSETGEFYIGGSFRGTWDLDEDGVIEAVGGSDGFLLTFSLTGVDLKTFGGPLDDTVRDLILEDEWYSF